MLQNWQPNTLPPPSGQKLIISGEAAADSQSILLQLPVQVDENDNFPKGRIARYFSYQGYGFIAANNGREYYFNLAEVDFTGGKGKDAITVGAPVGYDISRASHGLHVKKMKLY